MRRLTGVMLLLVPAAFALADKYAPGDDGSLAGELQWLTIQTACIGQYNSAQTGDYALGDPQDYYRPGDIRGYLTELSGVRTKTTTFYGVCFDYAQAAWDDIAEYQSYYEDRGMQRGGWHIAVAQGDSGEIILYDPAPREEADVRMNGVYIKEHSRHSVQAHGGATWHGWLWVYGNDGTVYWIDPTWTDNNGYVWWGVVQNGEEIQGTPPPQLSATAVPGDRSFASFNDGNANKNRGEYDRAIADYAAALRLDPGSAAAYYNRGAAYGSKGDYDQAVANYNQAIRLDPNRAVAYNSRGLAYYGKGDYDRAIADLGEAIKLDPDYSLAYNNRGAAYTGKRDYDRAIADLDQAIRLNPLLAAAYNNRGLAYYRKGNYDRAIADYHQAIRLNPDNASAYNNRGAVYYHRKDYRRARTDFEQALRLDPGNADARRNLGRMQGMGY